MGRSVDWYVPISNPANHFWFPLHYIVWLQKMKSEALRLNTKIASQTISKQEPTLGENSVLIAAHVFFLVHS